MLTKNDIKILDNKFDEKLKPIHDDIKTIKNDVKNVQKDVRKIKKDLDGHINLTDKWIIYHDKRIRKVETKLEIETPEFAGSQI